MPPEKSNIVLIGMAGCGKSSIGKLLARQLNRPFLDTDDLMMERQEKTIQQILDSKGTDGFRQIEEKILLAINVRDHVIATGGSSIYSKQGMQHLKKRGVTVLLKTPLDILQLRVGDAAGRGLVKQPGQSFEDIYAERKGLYEKYADISIDCTVLSREDVCSAIIKELKRRRAG